MITSQGTASHITHLLGPHPIVAHFLQRLKLQETVRSFVGSGRVRAIEHGEALATLVHNVLDSPAPLYRIAEWADPIEPTAFGFTAEQSAASTMTGSPGCSMPLSRSAAGAYGLLWRWTSSGSSRSREAACTTTPRPSPSAATTAARCGSLDHHGKNKDHRPDLKQLVFGLTVSADGASDQPPGP